MSDNPVFDYMSASALSLTMAGNTGISPFLTLFILSLVEKVWPDALSMGDLVEGILSSWWALILLGVLSAAEILAKCIPALDEIVDSVEVFLVPIISILATLSTLGMIPSPFVGTDVDSTTPDTTDGIRFLEEVQNDNNVRDAFLIATAVVLVIAGMILSLLIHLLKMIIRVSSLMCSAGCCQPCITLLELTTVCIAVVCAILSPIFAIVACVLFWIGAWYVLTVKCCCKKKEEEEDENAKEEKNAAVEPNDIETAPVEAVSVPAQDSTAPPAVEAKVF